MSKEDYSLIVNVEDDGQLVELMDGSIWTVPIGDHTLSICWYPTQRVVVESRNETSYPNRLRNLDTSGDVVRARPR